MFKMFAAAAPLAVLDPLEQVSAKASRDGRAVLNDFAIGDRVVVVQGFGHVPHGAAGTVVSVHKCVRPSVGRSAFEQEVRVRVCGVVGERQFWGRLPRTQRMIERFSYRTWR